MKNNYLQILILFCLFLVFQQKNQIEYQTALCVTRPTKCPAIKQRKGVCCKKITDRVYNFYMNSCIACRQGCQEFVYKRDQAENCDNVNAQGADL